MIDDKILENLLEREIRMLTVMVELAEIRSEDRPNVEPSAELVETVLV